MKHIVFVLGVLALIGRANAQRDTLKYDEISTMFDGTLLAVTSFPGELDVVFNTRFTPSDRCVLEGLLLGYSAVKFQGNTGNDTLVVWVYEAGSVPPDLIGVGRTYKFNLGDQGVPTGNIVTGDPLATGAREIGFFPLNPPIVFAPKRDFIIGVKMLSKQRYTINEGLWNGFAILINREVAEYDRFRRLMITEHPAYTRNPLVSGPNNASLYMRAVVRNDSTLVDTKLTDVQFAAPAAPDIPALLGNYPNPVTHSTVIGFSLPQSQHVLLAVYDALGREVARLADGIAPSGLNRAVFNAAALGFVPGLYTVRLSSGATSVARGLLVAR